VAPVVVLDRQHIGRASKPHDLGAYCDGLAEAVLVRRYLAVAEDLLRAAGCVVVPMSDGEYAERHARACAMRADVYVAGHVNAGFGSDGYAFYDGRSTAGRTLARAIAARLGVLPELTHASAVACASTGAWVNPWYTIRGVYQGRPVGLCYEPCFLDSPAHRPLLTDEGLIRIGDALAHGIADYLGVG
jgi:N-acetylmuramoyl-L-alanine amidase